MTNQIRQNRKTLPSATPAPFIVVYGPIQDVDNSTSYRITWDTTDAASDTSVFTLDPVGDADAIEVSTGGLYLISAAISCTPSVSGGRLFVALKVAGTVVAAVEAQLVLSQTVVPSPCSVPWPVSAGDSIAVEASQDNGLTLSVTPLQWSITRLVAL